MKKTIWLGVVATAMALISMVPQAAAAAGDSISFNLVGSPGLKCVPTAAFGKVTVSDLGPVQNMHIEVFGLSPQHFLYRLYHATWPQTVRFFVVSG